MHVHEITVFKSFLQSYSEGDHLIGHCFLFRKFTSVNSGNRVRESAHDLFVLAVCEVVVDGSEGSCVIISPRLVSKVSIRLPSSFIRCITCSLAAENFCSIC
jgi:hypothetical protein